MDGKLIEILDRLMDESHVVISPCLEEAAVCVDGQCGNHPCTCNYHRLFSGSGCPAWPACPCDPFSVRKSIEPFFPEPPAPNLRAGRKGGRYGGGAVAALSGEGN